MGSINLLELRKPVDNYLNAQDCYKYNNLIKNKQDMT